MYLRQVLSLAVLLLAITSLGAGFEISSPGNVLFNDTGINLDNNKIVDIGGLQDCSSNQYVGGNGNCQTDSFEANTDSQDIQADRSGDQISLNIDNGSGASFTDNYDPNSDASTECSGTDYLGGDGNCYSDSTGSSTDDQELGVDSTNVDDQISITNGNTIAIQDNYEPDNYDPNSDASTECSGSDYLGGDGNCYSDSYEANTDNQDIANVLSKGSDAGGDSINSLSYLNMNGPEDSGVGDINDDGGTVDIGGSTIGADLRVYGTIKGSDSNQKLEMGGGALVLSHGDGVTGLKATDSNGNEYTCFVNPLNSGAWECDGAKSWVHQLNKTHEAVYTSQESPDVRAVYEGSGYVEDLKKIQLPDHFSKTVSNSNPELRAQVTPQGTFTKAAVMDKTQNYIEIKVGKPTKINFRITGVREGYENKNVIRKRNDK
jgi:hypothetical protein